MTTKILRGLILALPTFISIIVYGQEKKQNKNDTTRNLEIGLDLLWLINKNQVPATTIFFRYNFEDKKQRHKALRFRLGFDTNNLDSVQVSGKDIKIDKFSPYVRLGLEWQRPLTKYFNYFYGIDISANYTFIKDTRLYNILPSNDRVLSELKDKTWRLGAHGFIGFRYKPSKWFSISSETSININYEVREWRTISVDPVNPQISYGTSGLDTKSINTIFIPITVLNFCVILN